MLVLISTASSGTLCSQCGFGWKAPFVLSIPSFSHIVIRSQSLFFTACVWETSSVHRSLHNIRSFHRHLLLLLYLYKYKSLYS